MTRMALLAAAAAISLCGSARAETSDPGPEGVWVADLRRGPAIIDPAKVCLNAVARTRDDSAEPIPGAKSDQSMPSAFPLAEGAVDWLAERLRREGAAPGSPLSDAAAAAIEAASAPLESKSEGVMASGQVWRVAKATCRGSWPGRDILVFAPGKSTYDSDAILLDRVALGSDGRLRPSAPSKLILEKPAQ